MTVFRKFSLIWRRRLSIPGKGDCARILVIHPSGHNSSSGPYLQALAECLSARGHAMLMLGERLDYIEDKGVTWLPFSQWRGRLTRTSLDRVASFKPDFLVLVGIRSRSMLAALEISWRHNLPMLLQAEDDDQLTYAQHYPKPDPALLTLLDTPVPSAVAVEDFVKRIDWQLTKNLWRGKGRYRLVEPVLRALALHRASAFGAIWQPMAKHLQDRFAKPAIIIPPVIAPPEALPSSRETTLAALGVAVDSPVIFVSGTVYNHSNEFAVFLRALNELHKTHRFTLVLTSRTHGPLRRHLRNTLAPEINYHILDLKDPRKYNWMLQSADIIAAPGLPDEFNRLRLSARIPRAMIVGKPVFTFACGFGESLVHGYNAVLTDDGDPQQWAEKLALLFDDANRQRIGSEGKAFAEQHFLAAKVAEDLSAYIQEIGRHAAPPDLAELADLKRRFLAHINFAGAGTER